MIHSRKDYQQRFGIDPVILDPTLLGEDSTPIANDEPVMLFRAKDSLFYDVLSYYKQRLIQGEADKHMIDAVEQQMSRAFKWRAANGVKFPDVPKE